MRTLRLLDRCVGALLLTVVAAGLWWWLPGPVALRWPLVVAAAAAAWWQGWYRRSGRGWWLARGACLVLVVVFLGRPPATDRAWDASQARIVTVERGRERWRIHHCRAARDDAAAPVVWETITLDPDSVDEVWLAICPFSPASELAHVFLSFGYREADGRRRYLAVSPEIRRERGEEYHPLAGCFRRYELMYIVAREGDLIGRRTNHLGEALRLYPVAVTPAVAQVLLRDCLARAERLDREPEWYHSLWNSCGSNLLAHGRGVLDDPRLRPSPRLLTPGRFDLVAWERGLLAVPAGIVDGDDLRRRYSVGERARRLAPTRGDFSQQLRAGSPRQ